MYSYCCINLSQVVDLEDGMVQLKEDLIQERNEAKFEKKQLRKVLVSNTCFYPVLRTFIVFITVQKYCVSCFFSFWCNFISLIFWYLPWCQFYYEHCCQMLTNSLTFHLYFVDFCVPVFRNLKYLRQYN